MLPAIDDLFDTQDANHPWQHSATTLKEQLCISIQVCISNAGELQSAWTLLCHYEVFSYDIIFDLQLNTHTINEVWGYGYVRLFAC